MAKSPFVIEVKGDFNKTIAFLKKLKNGDFYKILDHYGQLGVQQLRDHTPVYSGLASDSWYYEIVYDADKASIIWCNSDIEGGENVILLLEYGHGTKSGGYVSGIDIIDPALEPVFYDMVNYIWKEVTG